MTLATSSSRNSYTGNGAVDTYAYSFKILAQTHLVVTVATAAGVETTLALTTDYTVTGVGNSAGGNVVLVNSGQSWLDADGDLKEGYLLVIRRVVPLLQNTDIRNQGTYYPETIEEQFDYQVMIDQQQQEEINRSVQAAITGTVLDQDELEEAVEDATDAATAAASSASSAATSATSASGSATNASTSASTASTKASEASASAAAAAVSAAAAAAQQKALRAYQEKSIGVIYQAPSDGFVMYQGFRANGSGYNVMVLKVDTVNPPLIAPTSTNVGFHADIRMSGGMCAPVKSGDYYTVAVNEVFSISALSVNEYVWFVPLHTS